MRHLLRYELFLRRMGVSLFDMKNLEVVSSIGWANPMLVAYASCRACIKAALRLATARLGRSAGGVVLESDSTPVLNM